MKENTYAVSYAKSNEDNQLHSKESVSRTGILCVFAEGKLLGLSISCIDSLAAARLAESGS